MRDARDTRALRTLSDAPEQCVTPWDVAPVGSGHNLNGYVVAPPRTKARPPAVLEHRNRGATSDRRPGRGANRHVHDAVPHSTTSNASRQRVERSDHLMAATKRARFEVLRRDNHTCRYCGGTAPDVVLTVDHVTPVALGGSDAPDNLVAACKDCNAGKSSASPDAATVADVSEDALRWAQALRDAYADAADEIDQSRHCIDAFRKAWESWTFGGRALDLPGGWRSTVDHWRKMSVPLEVITHAVDMAMDKPGVKQDQKYRYMCGIVWRTIEDTQAALRPPVAPPAVCDRSDPCIDDPACEVPYFHSVAESCQSPTCSVCHDQMHAYNRGWSDGHAVGRSGLADNIHFMRSLAPAVERAALDLFEAAERYATAAEECADGWNPIDVRDYFFAVSDDGARAVRELKREGG